MIEVLRANARLIEVLLVTGFISCFASIWAVLAVATAYDKIKWWYKDRKSQTFLKRR